eukprot:GHVU01115320.1.p1 GENE.GHVU01115320.1~~GHVU01115320.1.p1  ORF type:complete len:142 (+),score=16.46 GHVU01115320.1:320-745(+)
MYSSTLGDVVYNHELQIMGFADDHSVYQSFQPVPNKESEAYVKMSSCFTDVHKWMKGNKLKMNTDKIEVIVFGSRHQCPKLTKDSLMVIDTEVKRQVTLKYLGAEMDMCLTMHKQISKKCQVTMYNLNRIRKIRQYLTEEY